MQYSNYREHTESSQKIKTHFLFVFFNLNPPKIPEFEKGGPESLYLSLGDSGHQWTQKESQSLSHRPREAESSQTIRACQWLTYTKPSKP